MPRLKEQSQQFHEHLMEVKRKTPLHPALKWYPWPSLGQFEILDQMLEGDTGTLLRMIGRETVLDVGCGDGDVAFFLESLGASVDVIDHAPTNYNALYGVRALKEAMRSPVTIQVADIDTRPVFPRERYGFTVMLGVLYHLKNPYLVLEEIAQRSDYIFLSTRVAQLAPDRKTGYGGNPVAYLVEEDELNDDYTNYWVFTEEALKRIVRRAGWEVTHYAVTGSVEKSDPVSPKGDARAYILAKSRVSGIIGSVRLLEGWHNREETGWRWTAKRFALEFELAKDSPSPALEFAFHLPEVVLAQHPSVTLRARIGDRELPPMTLDTDGDKTYATRLDALKAGFIRVDFEVDRAIGPTAADPRELGVLVRFTGRPPARLTS